VDPSGTPRPTSRLRFRKWTAADLPLRRRCWGDARVTALIGGPFEEGRPGDPRRAAGHGPGGGESSTGRSSSLPAENSPAAAGSGRGRRANSSSDSTSGRSTGERDSATEAARAAIAFAFEEDQARELFAGHHPRNAASARTLRKLGFRRSGNELYPPTGLRHPSYVLTAEEEAKARRIRESYDRVAPAYAENLFSELEHKPLDRALLDAFAEWVRGRGPVVDVGCGPGQVARYLQQRGPAGVGNRLVSRHGRSGLTADARNRLSPGLDVVASGCGTIPGPDASPSTPSCTWGRRSSPRSRGEVHRVLRPDGLLLLSFHAGSETVHRDELFGAAVDLDFFFFECDAVVSALRPPATASRREWKRAPVRR